MALPRRDASHASPPSPWVHHVPGVVSAPLDSEPCRGDSRRSPRKLKMSLVFYVFLIRERRRGFRDLSRLLTATPAPAETRAGLRWFAPFTKETSFLSSLTSRISHLSLAFEILFFFREHGHGTRGQACWRSDQPRTTASLEEGRGEGCDRAVSPTVRCAAKSHPATTHLIGTAALKARGSSPRHRFPLPQPHCWTPRPCSEDSEARNACRCLSPHTQPPPPRECHGSTFPRAAFDL